MRPQSDLGQLTMCLQTALSLVMKVERLQGHRQLFRHIISNHGRKF